MKLLLLMLFSGGIFSLLGTLYYSLKVFAPPSLNHDLKDGELITIARTDTYMIWVEAASFSPQPFLFNEVALLETKSDTIIPVDLTDFRLIHVTRRFKFSHLLYHFNAIPGKYRLLIEGDLAKNGRYYIKPSVSLSHFLGFVFSLLIGLFLCVTSSVLFINLLLNV